MTGVFPGATPSGRRASLRRGHHDPPPPPPPPPPEKPPEKPLPPPDDEGADAAIAELVDDENAFTAVPNRRKSRESSVLLYQSGLVT